MQRRYLSVVNLSVYGFCLKALTLIKIIFSEDLKKKKKKKKRKKEMDPKVLVVKNKLSRVSGPQLNSVP